MNFDNIFKFKTDEDPKKETISLNLPLWHKEDEPVEIKAEKAPVSHVSPAPPVKPGYAFERLDNSRVKGLPKFKPFHERISPVMYDKMLKNPTFPQISKAFADKVAEKASEDKDIRDVVSWFFQSIRTFDPQAAPEKILKDAKECENLNELFRAKIKYMDLAIFALIEGDATQLSNLMTRLHEIVREYAAKKGMKDTEEIFLKRYCLAANQPREIINLVNELYPRYEEELVKKLEHDMK